MEASIIIHAPVLREDNRSVRLASLLEFDSRSVDMWYEVPKEYGHWFCKDRADGFVVGLLLQAMQLRKDIVTHAPMSSKLWHNLTLFFIPMMVAAFPQRHPIRILPASLVGAPAGGHGVATGFSGGIDSFTAVFQHLISEQSVDHKVSHFLFHNAGSHGHGSPDASRRLFYERYEELKPFAVEAGIPFVPVDSNVSEIFPVDFIRMHPALNVSIPLVLQNQFQRYYYASTYKYADCGVNRTDDIARFDPLAFHLFSTEGVDCVSTGGQMSRVEKTRMIADFEPSYRFLNVCVNPAYAGRNCSVCFKCCRTLMTLELLGVSERFCGIFDVEKFQRVRNRYLLKCLRAKSGTFEAEVAALVREKGKGSLRMAFRAAQLLGLVDIGYHSLSAV